MGLLVYQPHKYVTIDPSVCLTCRAPYFMMQNAHSESVLPFRLIGLICPPFAVVPRGEVTEFGLRQQYGEGGNEPCNSHPFTGGFVNIFRQWQCLF